MTDYWEEIGELCEQLEKYYSLEADSHSEAMELLCQLSNYPDYISDDLLGALVSEMKKELKNYTENCTIVIRPETFTHDVAELEWKYQ